MTGPAGNIEFVSPRPSIEVEGKQNSLFPLGTVIKCLFVFEEKSGGETSNDYRDVINFKKLQAVYSTTLSTLKRKASVFKFLLPVTEWIHLASKNCNCLIT